MGCTTVHRWLGGIEFGHGVDEKSLISHLGKWNEDDKKSFWKVTPSFKPDQRSFARFDADFLKLLHKEFLRFQVRLHMYTFLFFCFFCFVFFLFLS